MLYRERQLQLSASDLAGHLGCRHLTQLDRAVAEGLLTQPKFWDPALEIMRERGLRHEIAYVEHLQAAGLDVERIDGDGISPASVVATRNAMTAGRAIIVQGALANARWGGRPDVMKRVDTPSRLGAWSYEVADTKLALETRAGTILQLCLYSDLVGKEQGFPPEYMHVVTPESGFAPETYRTSDYLAYYRLVKAGLIAAVDAGSQSTYPDPKELCEICRWRLHCDARRREDDHMSLVAGASKLQIGELTRRGVTTVAGLAAMPLPLAWKPERGAAATYERVREQARVQVDGRTQGKPIFETLPPEAGFGLALLPDPSPGDIFFDLEGDPFVSNGGIEYLFGHLVLDDQGREQYHAAWSTTRSEEKQAFERFVDFVINRRKAHPNLHIFHFAPYEPAALKRLMGRYATCEDEIDSLLRAGVFVDLYSVVKHGIRASVESYSIKRLEAFYGYERQAELSDAGRALLTVQAALELSDFSSLSAEIKQTVESYNKDDCVSTHRLRDWLENIRSGLVSRGTVIARPAPKDGAATEAQTEWQAKVDALVERLTADVPADPAERTAEQHARWILANTLDWHRRESKAVWWEYFRLADLSTEELIEERAAVANLALSATVGGTTKAPIHRYQFPPQETELRGGESLRAEGGDQLGSVEAISLEARTIDIKKRADSKDRHPAAVFGHLYVDTKVLAESLLRLGSWVADHGIEGVGPYQAARDLLLRNLPRLGDAPIRRDGETALEAALRLAPRLDGGVLAIQGPPGAGKTFTAAQMISLLVSQGAKIGVTANSHKVIRNLVDEAVKEANKTSVPLRCIQKVSEREDDLDQILFTTKNEAVFASLGNSCQVAAGTAWLWARPEAEGTVDVLFVDEAAQMSLANVLAISQAGRSLVLIGDPRQLEQPTQGTHPEGTGVSALDHLLGEHLTIERHRGLFLEQTWRLHPEICAFTSELFYEGRLSPRPGLERQTIVAKGDVAGSGLRYLPVPHEGNQSSSLEEADQVTWLVQSLLAEKAKWTDANGATKELTLADILVIAPYNAQVFELKDRLPGARIGTVDKFQGQQAPIVIYSMATSTPTEAPHGMEFLYSLNRLNVATSRAQCLCVLVASPSLFEPDCKSPRQMQLANAFCRYAEMAAPLSLRPMA